jgi:hypothetical protein
VLNRLYKIIFWTKKANGNKMEKSLKFNNNNNDWIYLAISYSNKFKYANIYFKDYRLDYPFEILVLGETTNLNYIGKSDTYNIESSSIIIDEIEIYDRLLDSSEIINDNPTTSTTTTTTAIVTTSEGKMFKFYLL